MFDFLMCILSSSSTTLVLICVTILFIYYILQYIKNFIAWYRKVRRSIKALNAFPGPPKHWLYGNIHLIPDFGDKGIKWYGEWMKKYPKGFVIWIGPLRPILSTCHPDTCKLLLQSTHPKQVNDIGGYTFVRPWLGDGLLLSSGDKWFRNRHLLTSGFHFDVLKPYMTIYNEASGVMLDKFGESFKEGRSVEVFQPVSLCTLDVILRCAFSSDMDVQRQGDSHPYVNSVIKMAGLVMNRAINPLMYPDVIYYLTPSGREFSRCLKLVHDVSTDVINKRRKTIKENPDDAKKRYPDFLDILLLARDENNEGLTDREIRDEVDTFLFEGHDTTASAISWALHTIAEHTEHQEKCYQEIKKVLSGRDTDDLKWENLNELPYLTLCIKESLRLHTPVPFIGREVDTELEIEGVKLPDGTLIEVNLHQLHHNEQVWGDDHDIFRPERFELGNMATMDPFAFVPFSGGPRNCIGQNFAMHEIKVVMAKTIHRYSLSVDPEHPALHKMEVVMRAEKGLHVFFNPRNMK